jgi:hypothetical protein
LSATAAPPAGASEQAATTAGPDPSRPVGTRWTWVAVGLASLAAFVALSWPLARHPDRLWTMTGNPAARGQPNFVSRPGAMAGGDHLQNVFIQSVVVDNLRELRDPFLDPREGTAGPAPLRTTSLDLPWTLLLALVWPLAGLVPAYNLSLALSTVATGLAAFGWLRRHVRWPLLAAAGALAYACTPHRMFQLTSHFNAVMWWAFPAALWALEALLQRWRARRRWRGPAAALAAVVLLVAVSGEYHLSLYMAGLLGFLALWALGAGLAAGRVPWGPLATVAGVLAVASGYVLLSFQHVFKGTVAGENGSWQQVVLYAPSSLWDLVHKTFGTQGEGMIYVGWPLLALAGLGLVAVAARRRAGLAYAVLALPLLLLTFGPRADLGRVRPYRFLFDHLPFLSLQRVPERLMAVTALVLVFLAVATLDVAAELLVRGGWGRRLAAATLCLAIVLLLADYRVSANRLQPAHDDGAVVAALKAAGDEAGPILGVPVLRPPETWNSVTTYLAAQTRRRALNAYNQTPAPWLEERLRALAPLNSGQADPAALQILRDTGTRQVVVIDEPRVFAPGQWQATVDALVASGRFRLVEQAAPLALLELTG